MLHLDLCELQADPCAAVDGGAGVRRLCPGAPGQLARAMPSQVLVVACSRRCLLESPLRLVSV